MTEEKNIDAGKQPDKSQEKFADKCLSDDELKNVASGTEKEANDFMHYPDDFEFKRFETGK